MEQTTEKIAGACRRKKKEKGNLLAGTERYAHLLAFVHLALKSAVHGKAQAVNKYGEAEISVSELCLRNKLNGPQFPFLHRLFTVTYLVHTAVGESGRKGKIKTKGHVLANE